MTTAAVTTAAAASRVYTQLMNEEAIPEQISKPFLIFLLSTAIAIAVTIAVVGVVAGVVVVASTFVILLLLLLSLLSPTAIYDKQRC